MIIKYICNFFLYILKSKKWEIVEIFVLLKMNFKFLTQSLK